MESSSRTPLYIYPFYIKLLWLNYGRPCRPCTACPGGHLPPLGARCLFWLETEGKHYIALEKTEPLLWYSHGECGPAFGRCWAGVFDAGPAPDGCRAGVSPERTICPRKGNALCAGNSSHRSDTTRYHPTVIPLRYLINEFWTQCAQIDYRFEQDSIGAIARKVVVAVELTLSLK